MGWGLGHATRCIPIIQSLSQNNEIIISSNGNSKILLKNEFPQIRYIDYPDYAVKYSKKKFMLIPFIILQLPNILFKVIQEYFITQKLIKSENIDIIISDSRYGVFSQKVPSFLILHQLQFQLDGFFSYFQFNGEWFNVIMFKNFKHLRKTTHSHHPVEDALGNAEALLHMKMEMGLKISLKK